MGSSEAELRRKELRSRCDSPPSSRTVAPRPGPRNPGAPAARSSCSPSGGRRRAACRRGPFRQAALGSTVGRPVRGLPCSPRDRKLGSSFHLRAKGEPDSNATGRPGGRREFWGSAHLSAAPGAGIRATGEPGAGAASNDARSDASRTPRGGPPSTPLDRPRVALSCGRAHAEARRANRHQRQDRSSA